VGIAVDGQGNLFVADTDYNRVIEIAASGGYKNITPLAVAFTFVTPKGIALDSSGNVYVADQDGNAVYRIVKAGGYTEVDPIGSGFKNPVGVAVDSSGNVYVSEVGYNAAAVEEIVASNGSTSASSSVKVLGGGFSDPQDVAVDASGNVYVSDSTYSYVKEIPSGCARFYMRCIAGQRPQLSHRRHGRCKRKHLRCGLCDP
jgi:streptogramin lyase